MANVPKTILIADDDPDDLDMLTEALKAVDSTLQIDLVSNGQDVLTYLSGCTPTKLPNLIVLDYKMPLLNGPEVLEALAADDRYAHIPKVIWSTSEQDKDVRRCMLAGARQYFTKPSNHQVLLTIAQRILEESLPSPA